MCIRAPFHSGGTFFPPSVHASGVAYPQCTTALWEVHSMELTGPNRAQMHRDAYAEYADRSISSRNQK